MEKSNIILNDAINTCLVKWDNYLISGLAPSLNDWIVGNDYVRHDIIRQETAKNACLEKWDEYLSDDITTSQEKDILIKYGYEVDADLLLKLEKALTDGISRCSLKIILEKDGR